jgi:aldehyde dehydrogenase (NAD+)/betaine-aldehyde dehydrogenase
MNATDLAADAGCYIAGSWAPGRGRPMHLMNPSLADVIGTVPAADPGQVDAALASSRTAFDSGPWSRLTALDRSRLLHRLADLIDRDREPLAQLMATEVGTPISLAGPCRSTPRSSSCAGTAMPRCAAPAGERSSSFPCSRDR